MTLIEEAKKELEEGRERLKKVEKERKEARDFCKTREKIIAQLENKKPKKQKKEVTP